MSDPAPDTVLNVAEVAQYLRVPEYTVYRMANAGQMPAFRVGGRWRFSRKRIEKWFAQCQDVHLVDSSTLNDLKF